MANSNIKLKISKTQSEEIINHLYPIYIDLCNNVPEAVELFKSKMEENIHHIIPRLDLENFHSNNTYKSFTLLETFTNIKLFSRNRKVWEKKSIVSRGSKCLNPDTVYEIIPAIYCDGELTMGTHHMHKFMHFLIIMGFFNNIDLAPCVPSHTLVVISTKSLSDGEMSEFVKSFDRAEDSYKNPEIIYTEVICQSEAKWVKMFENHPVLKGLSTTSKDLSLSVKEVMDNPLLSGALKVFCEESQGGKYKYPVFMEAMGRLQSSGEIHPLNRPVPNDIQQGFILGVLDFFKDAKDDYVEEELILSLKNVLTSYNEMPVSAKAIINDMVRIHHGLNPVTDKVTRARNMNKNDKNKNQSYAKLLMEAVFND